jgi:ATP-binding cassette subfamily F protein 3
VDDVAVGDIRKSLRNLLGCFLFSGDDVFKKVGVLSGGEKSRLALAKMLLQPCNLIVMDEPTNHLDMRSKSVMQQALLDFQGSYVIVSHDRDFLDPIVNKVVEFRRGSVKTYPGNVSDYLYMKQKQASVTVASEQRSQAKREESQLPEKERKRIEAEQRQKRYKLTKPVQDKIERVEKEIEVREREKAEMEVAMAHEDFYKDGEKVKAFSVRYKTLEDELKASYFRWNELTKDLERVQREADSAGH